jgi:hypothetical protein
VALRRWPADGIGLERIGRCLSVSGLVAGAIEALERDDVAKPQALLRDVAAKLALSSG